MEYLLVIVGLIALVVAGDLLVKGAVGLSLKLGVPALIVSLTIVAFGTSAPELLIAISASLDGLPELALGNVVGSNIANVLMVLGVPALIYGITMADCDSQSDYFFMLGISVVFIILCFMGPFKIWHGIILLGLLATFLLRAMWSANASREAAEELEEEFGGADIENWKVALFIVVGIIGLPIGAQLLVDNSIVIAQSFGVSEAVIGLTLVAIGTSLPELATTVMAARQRQADVAIGNVIGSNVFNLLAIVGVTTFFGNLPVPAEFLRFDLWIMLGASLLLIPFAVRGMNLTRGWGVAFCLGYVAYLWIVVA